VVKQSRCDAYNLGFLIQLKLASNTGIICFAKEDKIKAV
jgi:hypothetical protein